MAINTEYEQIGRDIIGAAFNVRKEVGRGLLEHYYEMALASELREMGHSVETQVMLPCMYKGREIGPAYRADIIVDNRVVIEGKALTAMGENECRQTLTYARIMSFKLAYLINFGARDFSVGRLLYEEFPLRKGIYRLVNGI